MIKSCIGRRSCRKPFRYVVQEKSAGERSASDIRQQHRRETILLHLSYVVKYPMTITNQTSKIRIHRCQSRMNQFKRIRFISHEVSTDIWQDLVCPQIGQPFKFNSWCVDHFGSVRWSFGPVSNNWTCMFLCDGEQGSREYLTNYKHIFPDFILQFHGVVAENHIHVRVRHVEVKNHKHHLDVTACGQTRLPKETACLWNITSHLSSPGLLWHLANYSCKCILRAFA